MFGDKRPRGDPGWASLCQSPCTALQQRPEATCEQQAVVLCGHTTTPSLHQRVCEKKALLKSAAMNAGVLLSELKGAAEPG